MAILSVYHHPIGLVREAIETRVVADAPIGIHRHGLLGKRAQGANAGLDVVELVRLPVVELQAGDFGTE